MTMEPETLFIAEDFKVIATDEEIVAFKEDLIVRFIDVFKL